MIFGQRVGLGPNRARARTCSRASASGTSPFAASRPGSSGMSCSSGISVSPRTTISRFFGEIQRHHRNVLRVDVLPDVQLRPVRERKHADALALVDAAVVQVPQLRPLVLRVPLASGRGTNRPAPWRAISPRRAARRRTPRRSRRPASASSSACVFSSAQHFCVPSRNGLAPFRDGLPVGVDDQLAPRSPRRLGRGTRSSPRI